MDNDNTITALNTVQTRATVSKQTMAQTAPTPTNIEQTGLAVQLLKDLVIKHIHNKSIISIKQLSQQLCLAGPAVEEVVQLLREEALIELSSSLHSDGSLYFRVTDRGRFNANAALERSGYIGPAPITLEHYREVSQHYSLKKHSVTRIAVDTLFSDFVIEQKLADQLGAAFNSRKAIFIYGTAGTGKTFTIGKMMSLFKDYCLIPYAIAINDSIVQIYDPQIHQRIEKKQPENQLRYADSYDQRLICCRRPVVITGGELTADLLEIQHDPRTKINQAPLQLKANNGIFFIDDIGRQSISPTSIFNRWIVPMEEGRDFLSLANGQHFEVPFDVQLVFSSNIAPRKLADDAALRRIGFKIHFEPISSSAYRQIWRQECEKNDISYDDSVASYCLQQLHEKLHTDLLPCHPRDLINMAMTQATYLGEDGIINNERIEWAWHNYFVQLDDQR